MLTEPNSTNGLEPALYQLVLGINSIEHVYGPVKIQTGTS